MESAEALLSQATSGISTSGVHQLDTSLLQIPALPTTHGSSNVSSVSSVSAGTSIVGAGAAVGTSSVSAVSANALTFTETQNGIDVMHHMKKMRDTERYCDVVLYVQGKKFKAHRNILAACSPYFSSIFKSNRTIRETIAITCQEPEVFQMFLNYIYTGTVTIEKSNVGELLRLANHFLMVRLKGYCGEYLERFLDVENCLSMKEIADKFSMTELAKTATNFVKSHLGDVINHEMMMDLSVKQIEKFVTEKAWNVPIDAAVKIMSRWICHDLSTRERDFKHLLTLVNWNLMDPTVIIDYIDQEPLYGSSERCFYYVLHSLAEKGIPVEKYESMYQALQQRFGQESTLGYGDNLLQMAFNSAMEGLQVPADSTILMPDGREVRLWGNKWCPTDAGKPKSKKKKSELPLTIEQRRKKYLAQIRRDRKVKKWVVVRTDNPKRRLLKPDELVADSSGDEECDPFQTTNGYRCHLCSFHSKKISKLERHLAIFHAHDVTYKCCECGFTCRWNREYFVHMKSHYEGPPFKCQSCEYSCLKIGSLIAHKLTHMDVKTFQCSECDFKCRSKANLAAHMKAHNNEKPYKCSTCSRSFANRNTLEQHMATHNPDKTYSCTQCSFTTKYLNHFSSHKKTHQAAQPPAPPPPVTKKASSKAKAEPAATKSFKAGEHWRCPDSSCKYTTNKKSQLDSHMRSHAGVRPHVCSICGRRFLEKSHLVRHERIHYNERPFKCEECDYASTRRDKLKEHKTRHHGVNASAKSPYKPRPHKGGKSSSSSTSEQSSTSAVVYGKKSAPTQQQQQQPPPQPIANATSVSAAVPQQQPIQGSQPQQEQTAVATAVVSDTSGELEFIIPHTHLAGNDGTAYAQINASGIDLHQLSNTGGIVQLRPYQPGKPEIQVAHTLASIPTLTPNDLSRHLGVKIEDLQAQGIIGIQQSGGRAIKLEEITGVSTQGGIVTGARVHSQPGTMIIDASQLQQIAQAAAAAGNSGPIPIQISSSTASTQPNNNQGNQSNDFGISMLY